MIWTTDVAAGGARLRVTRILGQPCRIPPVHGHYSPRFCRPSLARASISRVVVRSTCRGMFLRHPRFVQCCGRDVLLRTPSRSRAAEGVLHLHIRQLHTPCARGKLPSPHVTRSVQHDTRPLLSAPIRLITRIQLIIQQPRHAMKRLCGVCHIRLWHAQPGHKRREAG